MPSPQLFQRLGISHPVFQAPIGAIASAELAAAVAEAGGVGHLACTWRSPDQLRELLRTMRSLTKRAYGANLVLDFSTSVSVLRSNSVCPSFRFSGVMEPSPCPRQGRRRGRHSGGRFGRRCQASR